MKLYDTIQREIDNLKANLDIRDRSAIDRFEALEWVLELMQENKDLYYPEKSDLPKVVSNVIFDIEEYRVGDYDYSLEYDGDIEEIEATIRSLQAWRLFVLQRDDSTHADLFEAEDA